MKVVNILWTGGLDSSYRMIELSKLYIHIQPYYIVDPNRSSVKNELKAIDNISYDIKKNPTTKAKLLPIILIKCKDILPNPKITEAWKFLNGKYSLGSQYDFIARFAQQYNLKLEVGLEKSERGKAFNTITSELYLDIFEEGDYKVYVSHAVLPNNQAEIIFENLLFPCSLWNLTKPEEVENFREMGFEKSILKTWFCHNPILGLPCGQCNPCKDCINEGLAFRVPLTGRMLGWCRSRLKDMLKIIKYRISSIHNAEQK